MKEVLAKERTHLDFNVRKLQQIVHGDRLQTFEKHLAYLQKEVPYDPNQFNEGRIHMIKKGIQQIVYMTHTLQESVGQCILPGIMQVANQVPYSLHYGMFMTCIRMLGTQKQQAELMPKCISMEIVGCYAQTQMGHGSDVQSLETTATFDKATDEIILNSPTVSSAKYWPGDLGIFANYAMVFARLIVENGQLGVFPFLVQIRDKDYQPLHGIECGDIGPKFGFLTKDNGYLRMNNVRIPRTNMLSKYVGLSRQGDLEVNGNPKIIYAIMMQVRKLISVVYPKVYGQGIKVACMYSMFRKQFRNQHGEQQAIFEYQLQQLKLIPLIAEFYAIIFAGKRVAKLTEDNFKRVQKEDQSLMNETHAALCYTKAYFTDTVCRGLQQCRLACGGHGFAEYSGLPNIVKEFTPNVTHQGENSVMYLQVARYIMKSYKGSVLKKKRDLMNTVKYMNSIDYYRSRKCAVPENRSDLWTIEEVRLLLGKSVCYLIDSVYKIQVQNPGGSKQRTNDQYLGIRMIQMAVAHSVYNTYATFQESVVKLPDERIKSIMFQLCMIYGIKTILANPNALVQSGGIEPHHLSSLRQRMLTLVKGIRPIVIGLIDGFGIPNQSLRSPLVCSDQPYEKLLQIAKRSSLNTGEGCLAAAAIVRNGIRPKL